MIIEEVKQELRAEIELFKAEALKTHVVACWANSYTNSDPFAYAVNNENEIFWMKTQAHQLWQFWQSAKANVIPKDFVLVKLGTSVKLFPMLVMLCVMKKHLLCTTKLANLQLGLIITLLLRVQF